MVKILKIVLNKRKYTVETSIGEFEFGEEVIVEYFIVKGKEFSKKDFDKIISFADTQEYYIKALNYLSFKERTEFEIVDYLAKKGLDESQTIIDKLKTKGLINDERYAEHFLDYCLNNLKGPRNFESGLIKRRVDSKIIASVRFKYDFDLEYDTLLKLYKKTLRPKEVPYNKYKKQLMDKFARSGFGINVINEVLMNNRDELVENALEDKALERDYNKIKDLPKDKVIKKLLQKGYYYAKIKDIVN